MLELKREPEVVFWVFVFPLLLATGLGIAFRNKPADASSVAIVSGVGAQQAEALLQSSPRHSSFKIELQNADAARKGFRLGKYDLVIEPDGVGGLRYRYDPARPESELARAEPRGTGLSRVPDRPEPSASPTTSPTPTPFATPSTEPIAASATNLS